MYPQRVTRHQIWGLRHCCPYYWKCTQACAYVSVRVCASVLVAGFRYQLWAFCDALASR